MIDNTHAGLAAREGTLAVDLPRLLERASSLEPEPALPGGRLEYRRTGFRGGARYLKCHGQNHDPETY